MTDKQVESRLVKYHIRVEHDLLKYARPTSQESPLAHAIAFRSYDALLDRLRILFIKHEVDEWLKENGGTIEFDWVGWCYSCSRTVQFKRSKTGLYCDIWNKYLNEETKVYTITTEHGTITADRVVVEKDGDEVFVSYWTWWTSLPRGTVIGPYVKLSDSRIDHILNGPMSADSVGIGHLWEVSKCDQ